MLTKDEILQIKSNMSDASNEEFSIVFKALSDPMRCKIFELIVKSKNSLCVTDVSTYFNLSLSATSQKLHTLEMHGLLERCRDGKEVYFKVKKDAVVVSMMGIIKRIRK